MSIKPVLKLMMNNQLLALTGSNALLKPFYQLNYLVAAKECGLFELLLDAPKERGHHHAHRQDDLHGPGCRRRTRTQLDRRARSGRSAECACQGKAARPAAKIVDSREVTRLRADGASWRAISNRLGVGLGTVYRASEMRSKTPQKDSGTH